MRDQIRCMEEVGRVVVVRSFDDRQRTLSVNNLQKRIVINDKVQ